MPNWYLDNVDKIAAANKYTFAKPSREHIAKLSPGNQAKLIFVNTKAGPGEAPAERMWVEIDEVLESGQFRGTLGNTPYFVKGLNEGDSITFDASHIAGTDLDDEEEDTGESLVERYMVRCFASNRILRDGAKVGFLFRVLPEEYDNDPRVSGWVITAGDESEAYMADPENVQFVSLGAVLRQDDSIVALLDSPPGSAFGRDPETNQFVSALETELPPHNEPS